MRTYAQIEDVVQQMLQDTGAATYDTTETGYWIEESLKEFATYVPNIVEVIFKIESRTGTATSASSPNLIDATSDQFVATDDDNEKVIHNTSDNTWAVVLTYTDAENLILSKHIMASGENYAIYNKRCWNNRQIYIGNPTDIRHDSYLSIDSVEYPVGQKRNWKVYGDVLEIDVDHVANSDLTTTNLPNIDVLVRFVKPHRLCQMADLQGALQAAGTAGGVAVVAYHFTLTQSAEVGDEFRIANHRTLYTCTEKITWSDATNGNVLYFFPELEATAPKDDYIFFTKSTLRPQHEEIFCHLVAARAVLSDNIKHINAIPKGGAYTWRNFQDWGERKLAEVLSKLDRISTPKTKRRYPTG